MAVYYNDADPAACEWLRELIAARLLPAGEVDERSILEVEPAELRDPTSVESIGVLTTANAKYSLVTVPYRGGLWQKSRRASKAFRLARFLKRVRSRFAS
ncbi:hypothetical protein [Pontitalea aquivivens]|uniref:hypothetical protein n=1 Tax=Pontitalea aquivivens TaxID=3388663 RepID=UPI0039706E7A